jgi:death on curing protein
LPTSKVFQITAAFIEALHDIGISITWPGIEPVDKYDCLDLNLLESAAQQPFQGGFGVDYYPTIYDKAACLFFSIIANHIFSNGNKRTAVLALDQFLTANSIYLALSNDKVKKLAERTAEHRIRGETSKEMMAEIRDAVVANSFEFRRIRKTHPRAYREMHSLRRLIRSAAPNQPGVRSRQTLRAIERGLLNPN